MLHRLVKKTADVIFGNSIVRGLMLKLFGYRWNGWMLGLFGYRALHMVARGETCVLAGIYNVGTVLDFASVVERTGKVLVVEANPENAERLARETSHLPNVTVVNKAIWDSKGEMEFLCSVTDKDQGYNRLNSEQLNEFPTHLDKDPKVVMVQTDSIDNIANDQNLDWIDHVNLTINGAELHAIPGLSELRKINPGVRIYINSETPDPALKVVDQLGNMGFIVKTSNLIRVINKRIKLVRIYACQ